jgi:hypothetical protein
MRMRKEGRKTNRAGRAREVCLCVA